MDDTLHPVGEWAPEYAARLPLIAGFDENPWGTPSERLAAALRAWNAPFGEPESTRAASHDRLIDGPHGPIPIRCYRPSDGEPSGVGLVW